jgi:hypothetical protein
MTETHIAGELYGLSAHPGDIYHRAAMTVEMLVRERDQERHARQQHSAEIARLRKALVEIRNAKDGGEKMANEYNLGWMHSRHRLSGIARAALKEPT